MIVLTAAASLASCSWGSDEDDPDAQVRLSLTRPLLLADVPSYLEPESEITQLGATLSIRYQAREAGGPSLFLQEFEAELPGFPERPNFDDPTFEDSLDDAPGEAAFAAWRCGDLALSTLVSWEEPVAPDRRAEILDEIADLLDRSCADPSSVPTPEVDIDDVEVPGLPTCTPGERDSLLEVHVMNEGSESVFADVWAVDDTQVVETVEIGAGQTGTIIVDLSEFSGGFQFRMNSDPDPSPGFGYTAAGDSPRMRDETFVVTGPPLRVLPQDIEFTERNCL